VRIGPLLLVAALTACLGSRGGAGQGGGSAAVAARSIDEVLAAHNDSLLALPGVVGTAIGLCDGARCIKVLVADSSAATKAKIPLRLEGYRVVVELSGPLLTK